MQETVEIEAQDLSTGDRLLIGKVNEEIEAVVSDLEGMKGSERIHVITDIGDGRLWSVPVTRTHLFRVIVGDE